MTSVRQLFEYNPVFAYRFVPQLRVRMLHESGGYLIQTNSQGFRCNHDFVPKKTPNTRRVLLFGDSFTAGEGVSNDKRYGDILEKMIPDLEVYNFGMPGTGTDQQYLIHQHEAQKIEHDVLLISVFVENIRRNVAKYREYHDANGNPQIYAKPYYTLKQKDGNESLVLHGVPPSRRALSRDVVKNQDVDSGGRRFVKLREVVNQLGLRDVAQHVTRYQPLPEFNDPLHPDWLLMKAILKSWISQHSKPVLIFPIPVYHYIEETSDPSDYRARFREISQELLCTIHDPLKDLLKYNIATRRSFRFEKDIHLTPKGHQALATSLAPELECLLANTNSRSNT